jgi:hypothetical protein
MAGLGYKAFSSGEVLTAANLQRCGLRLFERANIALRQRPGNQRGQRGQCKRGQRDVAVLGI